MPKFNTIKEQEKHDEKVVQKELQQKLKNSFTTKPDIIHQGSFKSKVKLTTQQSTEITDSQYTPQQLALITRTVAKGATQDELAMFLHVSKKAGLDPFQKEIWFYKDNKGNSIIMTGRDGFLSIAQKSGEFAGLQSAAIYENDEFAVDYSNPEDIKIKHITNPFKKDAGKIVGAWARARRKGCIDMIEIVKFNEYCKQGKQLKNGTYWKSFWEKFPAAMIKKVAESIALKKQYGINGLISKEEMGYENEEDNPNKQIEVNSLFEKIKNLITKLPENKRKQAIENAKNSGQFNNKQIKELNNL